MNQLHPYKVDDSEPYRELLRSYTADGIVNFRNPDSGEREIISIGSCREVNWKIVNVARESEILRPVYRFLLIIILSAAAIFIVGTFVASKLSGLITISLSELNGWISNLHWDNISVDTPEDLLVFSPLSEFEEIHKAFREMNRKLAESMKLVVEERALEQNARMLALQSQMDPHFMYNMLTTISIMAEDGETDGIVDTINHLTTILRYTTSRSRVYVPLKEEADISRKFLSCMKVRYGDDLDFNFKIDKRLNGMQVPKLIILPLVENSIKYATDTKPPWKIRITGTAEPERWLLKIEDSGSGFSDEARKTFEASMRLL